MVLVATRKADSTEVIVKIRTKRTNRGGERTWRAIMAQVHSMRGSAHVLDITEILEDDQAFYVVKPKNIMFDLQDKSCTKTPKTVKLIDFDTCVEWTPASPKSCRFVGTPGYIAPEALLGEITPQSDLWSIGVILYILMTGETPWSSLVSLEDGTVGSPGATRMYNALKAEVLEWDKDPWPDFPLARELCQRLMAFNAEERPLSVQDALNHDWLRDEGESDA